VTALEKLRELCRRIGGRFLELETRLVCVVSVGRLEGADFSVVEEYTPLALEAARKSKREVVLEFTTGGTSLMEKSVKVYYAWWRDERPIDITVIWNDWRVTGTTRPPKDLFMPLGDYSSPNIYETIGGHGAFVLKRAAKYLSRRGSEGIIEVHARGEVSTRVDEGVRGLDGLIRMMIERAKAAAEEARRQLQ